MKATLWFCKDMNLWRWTVCKDDLPIIRQESGQNQDLNVALQEIQQVLECMMKAYEVK